MYIYIHTYIHAYTPIAIYLSISLSLYIYMEPAPQACQAASPKRGVKGYPAYAGREGGEQ